MSNVYTSSVLYAAVTQWAASTAYSSSSNGGRGDYRRQLAAPAVGSERVFRCTTAGTSGGSEPTWTLTKNGTTNDGTAVWTECTGQEADQVAGTWKAPHARMENAVAATWSAAGDVYYLDKDSADTRSTALVLTFPGTLASPNELYVVNAAGATLPPTDADLATTGSINTTGAVVPINIQGCCSIYGLKALASTTTGVVTLGGTVVTDLLLEQCEMVPASNGNLTIGSTSNSIFCRVRFRNQSKVTLANTAAGINVAPGAVLDVRDCTTLVAGTIPTTLFLSQVGGNGLTLLDGVDFNSHGSGKTLVGAFAKGGIVSFKDCKINTACTIQATITSPSQFTYVTRTDGSGTNYRSDFYAYAGTQLTSAAVVRTGTLTTDGTTPVSWKVTTTANAKRRNALALPASSTWNSITGASVTSTMYGVIDAAALPNNDEVWSNRSYLGSSGSPLASFKYGSPATLLTAGSALTADTSAWDSAATARVNSTTYAAGDIVKVASNPGRIFFCTTGGAAGGSEPGGYASAVDGGSVTDGAAVFRAGMRFKQAIAMTSPNPAMAGDVTTYMHVGKASATVFLDPSPVHS